MRMPWIAVAGLLLLAPCQASRAEEPIGLKVLYAGNPGGVAKRTSSRSSASTSRRSGRPITAGSPRSTPRATTWSSSTGPRSIRGTRTGRSRRSSTGRTPPRHPSYRRFDRPSILIGAAGGSLAGTIAEDRLAILCLDDAAHGVVPSHAVFNTPLKVSPTFAEVPTPDNYLPDAGDKEIGKTIRVWKVQTKKFPEINPGLVSSPHRFLDSPDAEVISSGLNSKGPDSVGLARHGNFFLWGFSASPADMTPEGRRCFVNAVCYIEKFDGQTPIVRKVGAGFSRDGTLWSAYYLRNTLDEDAFKRHLPESLRDDPEGYARYRRAVLSGFERSYPEVLCRRFGSDPEGTSPGRRRTWSTFASRARTTTR